MKCLTEIGKYQELLKLVMYNSELLRREA